MFSFHCFFFFLFFFSASDALVPQKHMIPIPIIFLHSIDISSTTMIRYYYCITMVPSRGAFLRFAHNQAPAWRVLTFLLKLEVLRGTSSHFCLRANFGVEPPHVFHRN